MRLKFWISFIVFLTLTIFVTACNGEGQGTDESSEDSTEEVTEETNDNSSIDKLVAGTDATYAPMEYIDDNGEIVGINIDIVDAIAEALDIEIEYLNIGWDPLFPAVDNEEVDFAVSSITITEKREEEFDFTDPYYVANQQILTLEDSDITSFADLEDLRVAVQISTTGHIVVQDLLGETNPNILAAETMPLAIIEMINGNADAAVGDNSTINEYLKNNPDEGLKIVDDDSFEKEFYGLMVKKGNTEVLDLLNEGIQMIKDNGKLEEISGFKLEE